MSGAAGGPADAKEGAADLVLAHTLFAIDPAATGLVLRSPAGPVRDIALTRLRALLPAALPWRRVPPGIQPDALLGGLDLTASLREGRRVEQRGLLAQAAGGVLVVPMAEQLRPLAAALLAAALDSSAVPGASLAFIALDEGEPDERLPETLADRLAFRPPLEALSHRDLPESAFPAPALVEAARARVSGIALPEEMLRALGETAGALGIASTRALLLAVAAARAAAALAGRDAVAQEDAAAAARLVFAPRATRLPEAAPPPEPPPEQPETPPEPESRDKDDAPESLPDADTALLIAAARAALPKDLLARLTGTAPGRATNPVSGRVGAAKRGQGHGRPAGTRAALPGAGLRLALAETLRAAAPWQRLRPAAPHAPPRALKLRRDDFRVIRTEQKARSLTIFVVDASGSSALNRLGEAKGAAELLLADCYTRRDQVAVIAFRGKQASLLLPPTRALARAKRSLASLPGGGATPLAAGLLAARDLAEAAQRTGQTPTVVVLTDGRANMALDGQPGRARAEEDAKMVARTLRACRTLLIDIAPRPAPQAQSLAATMGARYLPLPFAGAAFVSAAVRSLQ